MTKLYEELKRRNVFRVGATYMVLAWLLMQFASIVLPTFDAPRWLLQAFLFFLILGFPLALVLAWAFELTPDGIRTAATAEPSATFAAATSQRLNYLILTLVVLAVGFLLVDRYVSGAVVAVRNAPVTSAPPAGTQRLSITLPDNQPVFIAGTPSRSLALSPDGRQVVYLGANIDGLPDQYGNQRHLLLRQLDSRTVRELPGTRG
ncbi:MAG: hypothetical protein Q8L06_07655, partial [Pseudohongiella sp.]|nr:hypothetical protein [Pseudohongiella sp.]